MKKILTKEVILGTLLIVMLIPVLYIARYDAPSSDDFSYSYRAYQSIQAGGGFFGVLDAAVKTSLHYMESWQGLYASSFLQALQPGIFGISYYGLTCVYLVGATIISMLFFFRGLCKKAFGIDSKLWIFLGIFNACFIIQCIPSPVEGLYWFNGGFNYHFMWCLSFLYYGLMFEFAEESSDVLFHGSVNALNLIRLVICCILAVIISGGNHVTALLTLGISTLFVAYGIWKRKFYYIAPLFFGIAGFTINITSEGTARRQSLFTSHPRIIETLVNVVKELLLLLNEWLNISLICYILVASVIIFVILSERRSRNIKSGLCFYPLFVLIGSVGILICMLCIPYYVMENFGAIRLTNVVWETFIVLLFYNLWNLFLWLDQTGNVLDNIKKNVSLWYKDRFLWPLICGTAVILCICILGNGTLSTSMAAVKELRDGSAKIYYTEMTRQDALMRTETTRDVLLDPITEHPALIFHKELSTDPEAYQNAAAARYYGKDSVTVKE